MGTKSSCLFSSGQLRVLRGERQWLQQFRSQLPLCCGRRDGGQLLGLLLHNHCQRSSGCSSSWRLCRLAKIKCSRWFCWENPTTSSSQAQTQTATTEQGSAQQHGAVESFLTKCSCVKKQKRMQGISFSLTINRWINLSLKFFLPFFFFFYLQIHLLTLMINLLF